MGTRSTRSWVIFAILAIGGVGVAGCEESNNDEPKTVVSTETETAPPASDITEEESTSSDESSASGSDSGGGGGDITVPDVVGKDHQLAQDTMQAAGLYSLAEEDATGQGRLLIR